MDEKTIQILKEKLNNVTKKIQTAKEANASLKAKEEMIKSKIQENASLLENRYNVSLKTSEEVTQQISTFEKELVYLTESFEKAHSKILESWEVS